MSQPSYKYSIIYGYKQVILSELWQYKIILDPNLVLRPINDKDSSEHGSDKEDWDL